MSVSEDDMTRVASPQTTFGTHSPTKIEHSRLAIPSNSKGYNTTKHRHSSSSISLLKSIPEAAGNGASEIETVENMDLSSTLNLTDKSNEGSIKSAVSTPGSTPSLLEVTLPKGPTLRSASLQPPQETEEEIEMALFNRRQSGKYMLSFIIIVHCLCHNRYHCGKS